MSNEKLNLSIKYDVDKNNQVIKLYEDYCHSYISLRETAIRQGLIDLGWTPPNMNEYKCEIVGGDYTDYSIRIIVDKSFFKNGCCKLGSTVFISTDISKIADYDDKKDGE